MFFIKTEEEKEISQIELNRVMREELEEMEMLDRLRPAFSAVQSYGPNFPKDVNKDSENQTEEK